MAVALAAVALFKAPVLAATGDNVASFDASVTAGIPQCASGVGTGIAYDGTDLLLSCWSSNVLQRVNAATHLNSGAVTIAGVSDLGAMSWDQTRGRLWACQGGSVVTLIDVGAAAVDGVTQPSFATSGCIDGLAYDGSDDSIWTSADATSTTCHYKLNSPLAPTFLGCFSNSGLLGGCGNSGIVVGGPSLYLANNGCSQIYTVNKTFTASTLFATFGARLEDLECDGRTFSNLGKSVIWSQDAYDRIMNAWEIEGGLCAFGGLAFCGDGDLDAGEQCDDGNNVAGDGCDPDCQIEGCGNGILDAGEECDLSSPAGAFCLGGATCSASCTCDTVVTTTTSPTTTTSSTTSTTLLPVVDHMQCYEVKPGYFPITTVTGEDQFGAFSEGLRAASRLCAPTNKNNEGITDPTDYLTGYRTRGRTPRFTKVINNTVVDQFGTLKLDVVHPDLLMVPSSVDGVPQLPPLDHFQCYKVKRSQGSAKFVKRTVSVTNGIEPALSLTVLAPYRLCAPANKNGEDPTAPDHVDHLLCYKTKGPRFTGSQHALENQFGPQSARLIARRELCLPALKNPPPPTTTTSTVPTTSTTVASTTTTTSTTSTTTTTLYGSPSRAFLIPADSLLD